MHAGNSPMLDKRAAAFAAQRPQQDGKQRLWPTPIKINRHRHEASRTRREEREE
jgi:hypothetical protein